MLTKALDDGEIQFISGESNELLCHTSLSF